MERELLNREKASQTHADRKEDEMPETSGGEEASALSVPEWEDLPERGKRLLSHVSAALNLLLFLGGVLGAACGILAAGLPGKILLSALGILLLVLFGMTFRYTWRERDRIFSQKQDEEQDKGLGGRHSWSRRTEAGLSWKRNAGAGSFRSGKTVSRSSLFGKKRFGRSRRLCLRRENRLAPMTGRWRQWNWR